jgi:hypothetical protein
MRVLRKALEQRRRLAPLVAVAAVLAVGWELWNSHPRETEILVVPGPGHRRVVEIGVRFMQQGDEMHGLRLAFPGGAPRLVPCRVRLAPGRYRVRVDIRQRDGRWSSVERELKAPADGPVRIEAVLPASVRDTSSER